MSEMSEMSGMRRRGRTGADACAGRNAKRPLSAGVSKKSLGGKCKFRTCDPCSVNAVLYP